MFCTSKSDVVPMTEETKNLICRNITNRCGCISSSGKICENCQNTFRMICEFDESVDFSTFNTYDNDCFIDYNVVYHYHNKDYVSNKVIRSTLNELKYQLNRSMKYFKDGNLDYSIITYDIQMTCETENKKISFKLDDLYRYINSSDFADFINKNHNECFSLQELISKYQILKSSTSIFNP